MASQVTGNDEPGLDNLSLELVFCMLDHLDRVDAACLALCNRFLLFCLGTKYFGFDSRTKLELVHGLVRDDPTHFL
jgi:hypothetical protein